jgi:adenylate kinase
MAEENVLVERLSARLTCREKGHTFNAKTNPPREDMKCDVDGSELYQRDDDKAETVKRRIDVYLEQTSPLISHYRDHGKLVEIDGMQPIEQVTDDLVAAMKLKK